MRLLFGKLAPRGWWKSNVDSDLNAGQVLELLERDADWHPAIPRIQTIVRGFLASRGRRDEYRCGRCMDATWVFHHNVTTVDGNKTPLAAVKCRGTGNGCPADAWRLKKVRERLNSERSNAVSGEGASL